MKIQFPTLTAVLFSILTFTSAGAYAQTAPVSPPAATAPGAGPKAERPWLGITAQDINKNIAGAMGLKKDSGVLVYGVSPGSPAEGAGIAPGDIIVTINGKEVLNSSELISLIQSEKAGDSVVINLDRNGKTEKVSLVLGSMPADLAALYSGSSMYAGGYPGSSGGQGCQGCAQGGCCGGQQGCMGGAMGQGMAGGTQGGCCGGQQGCMGGTMGQGMADGAQGGCCAGEQGCMGAMMGKGMHGMMGGMGGPGMGMMGGGMMDMNMGMMEGGKYGKMYLMALHGLNLTEDQQKKAESLISDYQKKTIKSMSDIGVAEVELKDLMGAATVNLEKVRSKINDISAKRAELRFYRVKTLEEFKKILTPEQRKKMKEMMMPAAGSPMMGHDAGGEAQGNQ